VCAPVHATDTMNVKKGLGQTEHENTGPMASTFTWLV